jgi:hypothetical protein
MDITESQHEEDHREKNHPEILHLEIPILTGSKAAVIRANSSNCSPYLSCTDKNES